MSNTSRVAGLKHRVTKDPYAEFDALPREVKELLWDAWAGTLHVRNFSSISTLRVKLLEAQCKDTRAVYGPDHPQAERDRAENFLADLGLL